MTTVAEAVDAFLIAKQADGAAAATVAWYRYMLLRFTEHLGHVPLERLTSDHLRAYVVALKTLSLAHETLRAHIRAMKAVLLWAWEEYEYPRRCPAERIKTPAPRQGLPRAIELGDIRLLIKACEQTPKGKRDRALIMFLTDTGCRAGGVLGLTPEDVDLTRRLARLREKGDRERLVPFTVHTATAIREWLEHRPRGAKQLFCSLSGGREGGVLKHSGLRTLLNRLARAANVRGRVNPHSFRHAFARAYLSNGGDLATLAQLLGHKDVSTTANIYTRYTVEELAVLHGRYSPIGLIFHGMEVGA